MHSTLRQLAVVAVLGLASTVSIHGQTVSMTIGGSRVAVESPTERRRDPGTGKWVGVGVVLPAASMLDVRIGIEYVQKGSTEIGGDIDRMLQLDYLELPTVLSLRILDAGPVSTRLLGGMSLSVRTSCRTSITVRFPAPSDEIPGDCRDVDVDLSRVDLMARAGASVTTGLTRSLAATLTLVVSRRVGRPREFGRGSLVRTTGLLAGVHWIID